MWGDVSRLETAEADAVGTAGPATVCRTQHLSAQNSKEEGEAMTSSRRSIGFERLETRCVLSTMLGLGEAEVVRIDIPDLDVLITADQFSAPVNVSNAQGIRGVEVRLGYDAALLQTSENAIRPGSLWSGVETELVLNLDKAAGTIDVWIFAAEALGAEAGSLLDIDFQPVRTPVVGETSNLDLRFVRLNEGQITVDPPPQPGLDETDGLVTFTAVPEPGFGALSGFVYADTNNNQQPDPTEGVPGVKIVLVNSAGASVDETWTDHDGWYEFREVAAGSYQIQQRQPESMINGGDNQIDVQLAADQSRADLHFRELGLKPEFMYTRLLAASSQPAGSPRWTTLLGQIESDAQIQSGNTTDPAPPTTTPSIVRQGAQVVVQGGSGDDVFRFQAGTINHTVTLNDQTQQFPASEVTSVRFDGGLGRDTVELIGNSAQDQLDLSPKTATLQGAGYTVQVTASEHISVRSTGPGAQVRWLDSPVDDRLSAQQTSARMDAFHYRQEVSGFQRIVATSQQGGEDRLLRAAVLDYVLEQTGPWIPGDL